MSTENKEGTKAPVVVLDAEQTRVFMSEEDRRAAIDAAIWVTASPHEWNWSPREQELMARYVLWAHQRLSGIAQLATGELERQREAE